MNIDLQAKEITPVRHTFDRVIAYTGDKPASRYLESMLSTQSTENFHYRPTWEPEFELHDIKRTAIQLRDWNALRDPRQFYYAAWTMTRARQQESIEANHQFVESRNLLEAMPAALHAQISQVLIPLRHVSWGGNMNNCNICSRGYGTALTAPALMHAMDHLGAAQYITRLGLAAGEGTDLLDHGKQVWLEHEAWQPLRKALEDSFVIQDPIQLFVWQNLALEGLLFPLIYDEYIDNHVMLQGGSAIAMLMAFMPEWHRESARWVDAVIKVIAAESDDNKRLVQSWVDQAVSTVQAALLPIARLALQQAGDDAMQNARTALCARLTKIGLQTA
ncbi:MAG TPA: phenol hydroxylase [Pusillimonas sp.]|uniref:phenol hydroxylase n=1 Tax=Pusillimonas sp. TaxID=3040095 RepID=UPI002C371B8C|nr:phenol hydroxylase [Pusillimonas sp.]HUH88633.1 phenol hydroxylase [Pusillimonas sp.]